MKANELMLGDLVLYEYNSERFTARVKEIYTETVRVEEINGEYEIIGISIEDIYPIELTQEILEKNGFKWENGPYSRWCHAQVERMIITLYRSDTFYSITIHTDDYLPVLNNIQLHSVHELQHALRLCGIDKEIEL